jgi:hypothetical protein
MAMSGQDRNNVDVGREAAIGRHLRDGEEFEVSIRI